MSGNRPDGAAEVVVRTLEDDDLDAALTLWAATEHLGPTPREELDALRAHDPELVLAAVAVADAADAPAGALLGVVLGSFDGRRGWISRLAVAHAARRRGVARRLVVEVERRLAARGCRQVNLLTFTENHAGRALWEALGYHGLEQVVLYSRRLHAPDRFDARDRFDGPGRVDGHERVDDPGEGC